MRAQTDLAQQRDGAVLQYAGADARQHVGATLLFQYDAIDAISVENMRQQQTGRAAADDRHLRSRRRVHRRSELKRQISPACVSGPN
jgi:hypothetical protein